MKGVCVTGWEHSPSSAACLMCTTGMRCEPEVEQSLPRKSKWACVANFRPVMRWDVSTRDIRSERRDVTAARLPILEFGQRSEAGKCLV